MRVWIHFHTSLCAYARHFDSSRTSTWLQ